MNHNGRRRMDHNGPDHGMADDHRFVVGRADVNGPALRGMRDDSRPVRGTRDDCPSVRRMCDDNRPVRAHRRHGRAADPDAESDACVPTRHDSGAAVRGNDDTAGVQATGRQGHDHANACHHQDSLPCHRTTLSLIRCIAVRFFSARNCLFRPSIV